MSLADVLGACLDGLVQIMAWPECGLLALGVVLGAVVGILPGLGGSASLAILLPLTLSLPASQAFALLIGVAAVVATTGDLTSILVGIPGEATSAATVVDGHRMTLKGEAARAIGASLASSLAGSIFGALTLALSIPLALWFAREVGSPELFMLALVGITFLAPLTRGSRLKGLIAGALGALLGTVGMDPMTGTPRFTFGQVSLWDGIGAVPLALGLFALPEIVQLAARRTVAVVAPPSSTLLVEGMRDARRQSSLVLQSSALATIVGIVPGIGASVAQWLAYALAARRRPSAAAFGDGAIEGVIAPSAANNATLGASLIPTLALGVPGGVLSALLLSALLMKGLVPGPTLLTPESQGGHLTLVFSLVWLLVVANVMAVGLALASTSLLVRITRVSGVRLVPFLLVLTLVGAFAERRAMTDILIVAGLGLLGLAMVKFDWPRAPMLMGLVLVPLAENRLFVSIDAYGSGWIWRPGVIAIAAAMLVAMLTSGRRWRGDRRHSSSGRTSAETRFAIALLPILGAVVVGSSTYGAAAIFPRAIAIVTIICLLMLLRTAAAERDQGLADESGAHSWRRVFAWLSVFMLSTWALGFTVGAPLATFAYFAFARERWAMSVIASVAVFALLYGLLGRLLAMPFPPGALLNALAFPA